MFKSVYLKNVKGQEMPNSYTTLHEYFDTESKLFHSDFRLGLVEIGEATK